ncbi:hypothetical protein GOA58_07040 [Sinorhizobium meliloti]|uniref:hypothetical protein n=1 Tax=Sinorhizobium TaxID=28105 RepID=UPI001294BD79|nr:hypothetical protein [Sinorhizobium medicae]MDW9447445.1 hypothetical protein [Sinorhizobium meliloti]MDW9660334.1 hypothetical protein [Sinorhizobium meliloti]MDX0049903.1 hypothetical protein [Sinorhizobium meliloti]MQV98349.1 hypothetical protein [Sinorhizobium medicae]
MARMNLSGWTPEAKKARKHEQADARKKKQRAKEKEEREMAKKKSLLTSNSPEVVEFVDELRGLKFRAMIEPIAYWEREHKQRLPVDSAVVAISGETPGEYQARNEHHRQLCLARFYSPDFYARQQAAERKKKFDLKEAREAKRLGITVFELRKQRKIAAAAEAKKARAVERLAQKQAA